MKLNAKGIGLPALLLFAICLCVTLLLAVTNTLTEAKILANATAKEESSRMIVLPDATSFEVTDDCAIGHNDANDVVGYVFVTSAKGYGGDVQVMTGIDAQGVITGVVVLDHDETPGLGANCERETFRAQYLQKVPASGSFTVVKNQEPAEGQIQAMTGASITSRAVTEAVSAACELYNEQNKA